MHGELEVVASVPEAFTSVAADHLARAGGGPVFFSGGPTARACYEDLADASGPGGTRTVPWERVDAYWGDERCVPPDDPDSNHALTRAALLDRVGPLRSVHPMFTGGDPEGAAAAYAAELSGLTTFGLVHLGMGPDGHCASLFPGAPALDNADPGRPVVATVDPTGTNPHPRLSLTLPAIARADLVVFTVSGTAKHDALARVRAGEDLPAARVRARRVLWLVDGDAAG